MALQFTSAGTGEDAELFIHLDIEGLAALLRAVEAALASGRGQVAVESASEAGEGGSERAFGKVTVTFLNPAGKVMPALNS